MGLSPIWLVSVICAGVKGADIKFGVIRANKLFTNIPIWGRDPVKAGFLYFLFNFCYESVYKSVYISINC